MRGKKMLKHYEIYALADGFRSLFLPQSKAWGSLAADRLPLWAIDTEKP
jgi:hypothetical protein